MLLDISKLQNISIWTSDDYFFWTFYAEIRMCGLQLNEKSNSANDLIQCCLIEAQKLITGNFCRAFRIQLKYDSDFVWFSSQDNAMSDYPQRVGAAIGECELLNQKLFYNKLTKREKQILLFSAKNYKQSVIVLNCGMGLETFKTHKRSLYKKMNFKAKSDLIRWADKYLEVLFKDEHLPPPQINRMILMPDFQFNYKSIISYIGRLSF